MVTERENDEQGKGDGRKREQENVSLSNPELIAGKKEELTSAVSSCTMAGRGGTYSSTVNGAGSTFLTKSTRTNKTPPSLPGHPPHL